MSTALLLPAARPATTGRLLAAGLLQAYTRDGFDPARHPLSSLALGDLGWLQTANFVVCGLLTLAGAVGLRPAYRTRCRGTA